MRQWDPDVIFYFLFNSSSPDFDWLHQFVSNDTETHDAFLMCGLYLYNIITIIINVI